MINKTDSFTLREIEQQPGLWQKVFELVLAQKDSLKGFINKLQKSAGDEIILTGAGSSFFVGEMVAGYFQKYTGFSTKAVSTTELVTHPLLYINPAKQTLLVSFARSGNSPESVAAVKFADQVSKNINHLIITCNQTGELSKLSSSNPKYVFNLPEEANDKGLAMTSSVTSMALAALLISRLDEIETLLSQVRRASDYAENLLSNYSEMIEKLSGLDFKRAVFLGSGPLMGVAREAHLKLQEMTDGKVICKFDSFLSFRHGPKVVLDENTLLVYFFSNDEYVLRYEKDLVLSVAKDHKLMAVVGVSETKIDENVFDFEIIMNNQGGLDESFLGLCELIPAQLFGYHKSLDLGLNPDQPSNGAIHRVVQGVVIYDLPVNDLAVSNF
jgi:tagatose-6-phosphate ketose/aldose isomerase